VVTVTDGKLKEIIEKPTYPSSQIISAGIYAFNTEAFRYLEAQLTIPDALMMMLRDGLSVSTVETNGLWADVVYPWDLLNLNSIMLRDIAQEYAGTIEQNVAIRGPVTIGKDTIIRHGTFISGPVVIGEGCDIGPDVCIFPATSIGSNVVISPFSEIKNAVIEDDVHIGTGSIVQDSVIDKGCVVGPRFCASSEETEVRIDDEQHSIRMGIVMGEGCTISSNVTVQPGTIVGNYCQVKSQRLVGGGVIPDKSILI